MPMLQRWALEGRLVMLEPSWSTLMSRRTKLLGSNLELRSLPSLCNLSRENPNSFIQKFAALSRSFEPK